jgi:hypothetical protein
MRAHQVPSHFLRCHANAVVWYINTQRHCMLWIGQDHVPVIMTRPPDLSSSLTVLMVILRGLVPSQASLLVSEVKRSFSRASFAFEMSSRRKTSLLPSEVNVSQISEQRYQPVRVKTWQWTHQRRKSAAESRAYLFITILRRRATSL